MENFICNLSIGRYYSSIKCTALYSLTLALLCSILPVLLCLVLPCTDLYCFVLFCYALVRIMKKKKWSRMYHTDSKSVSEYVPLIPDQSQLTRSQRHSMVQLLPLVPDQYHWSQINGGHPSVGSTVVTTMRPSVLLWSLTSFPCSFDQMRGTSHESQTAWVGCLDRRTHQSYPHRRTHQSCYNCHGEHINPGCHGEHINPGLTGEHINPTTVAMENTSI